MREDGNWKGTLAREGISGVVERLSHEGTGPIQERLGAMLRVRLSATITEPWEPSSVTAAVLAGGLGTRLRPVVGDRPKVLRKFGRDLSWPIC